MDLAFKSLTEQAGLIRRHELSPVELLNEYLRRIEALDSDLHAYIKVFQDQAREDARGLEAELLAGQYRGPLHGIPFAVKDVFDIRGEVVTGGLRLPPWGPARDDATVIKRLRAAGAVLVGTLNTHELQLGGTAEFAYGLPLNPHDKGRATGGSSSGSAAAVASGLCTFSLGVDTGGSVRVPASYCGVVGLKPTWSRVSRHGVKRALWTLDSVGIFARGVRDAALVLGLIAGQDTLDPTSSTMPNPVTTDPGGQALCYDGLRVGAVSQYFDPNVVSADVLEAAEQALVKLQDAGAEISEVNLPSIECVHAVHHTLVDSTVATANVGLIADGGLSVDRNTRIRLLAGAVVPAQIHGLAERARTQLSGEIFAALNRVDMLVGPTTPTTAPPLELKSVVRELVNPAAEFNRPYSFAGIPAISVPVGRDREGLPIGLQMAAAPFKEVELLEYSSTFAAFIPPAATE